MALPQIIARNQQQQIARIKRGSRATVLGSGGVTEATVFEGPISTYAVPTGKNGLVKGSFIGTVMGTNTVLGVRVFDQSRALGVALAQVTAANIRVAFETVLGPDDRIQFTGNNAANDGSAECEMEIQERPA